MQDYRDLIATLNRSGKKLSKCHRRITDYIVEHIDKSPSMTTSKLASEVGVSESTVVRFATAMGYDGYASMQRTLQELAGHYLTGYQRMEMSAELEDHEVLGAVLRRDMNNLRMTLDNIDQDVYDDIVRRILSAHAIYIMGLRSAAPLAQFMDFYMNYIFDNVHLVSSGSTDVFESISKLHADDLLIGISFPRYSSRTLDAMSFAKRCGAQVVAITDGPMSPLARIADATLTARTDMASFVDSLAAPLSLINALLVSLGLQRKDALSEHFQQLESVWNTYNVYME